MGLDLGFLHVVFECWEWLVFLCGVVCVLFELLVVVGIMSVVFVCVGAE